MRVAGIRGQSASRSSRSPAPHSLHSFYLTTFVMSKKEENSVLDSISMSFLRPRPSYPPGNFIFGQRLTPEEQVKKWKRELSLERRGIDRGIRGIEREERKTIKEAQLAAKRGDVSSARNLAKELVPSIYPLTRLLTLQVRSRNAKQRMAITKAQLNSVEMQLSQNMGTYPTRIYFIIISRLNPPTLFLLQAEWIQLAFRAIRGFIRS